MTEHFGELRRTCGLFGKLCGTYVARGARTCFRRCVSLISRLRQLPLSSSCPDSVVRFSFRLVCVGLGGLRRRRRVSHEIGWRRLHERGSEALLPVVDAARHFALHLQRMRVLSSPLRQRPPSSRLRSTLAASATLGGALPAPLPLFPSRQLVERRTSRPRRSIPTPNAYIAFINNGTAATAASRLRWRGITGQRRASTASRTSSSTARSRSGPCSSSTATRATASITRPIRAFRSIRFRTKRSRSRTGSKAASRATSIGERPRSPHAHRRSRQPSSLRAVQRLLRRQPVARRLRRVLRSEHQRPAARRLDLGRCRGPRDPAGLVRYDEVFGPDEIDHAFRVTVRATNGYVYPGVASRRHRRPARCRWARGCG